ncbi:MAG TPA: hypothetical protein VFI31_09385 [Pirellulales bacterium]|nr:hypothetical protein [Pirellulales bacterium]
MKRTLTGLSIAALTITLAAAAVAAQKGKNNRNGTGATPTSASADGDKMELAADPQLQKIQMKFVIDAAKLAKDYERKNDIEGARSCYEQILRVVPHHPEAQKALERIRGEELTKERKKVLVKATEGWQDAGINVLADRPLTIHAEGTWTFAMKQDLDADGMEIPKDLKDFNLGCLVGKIVSVGDTEDSKPFMIGKEVELTPEKPGRLWMRMYDYDPSDNKGLLNVEIQGTFEKGK